MDDSFFRLGAAHHAEEAAYRSTLFTTTSGLPTHPRIRSGRAGPHFPEVLYSHAHTPGFIPRATGPLLPCQACYAPSLTFPQ